MARKPKSAPDAAIPNKIDSKIEGGSTEQVSTASMPPAPGNGGDSAAAAGGDPSVVAAAALVSVAQVPVVEAPKAPERTRWTVLVQGPAKGRWRIGRLFGAEPVSIQAVDLTEAEFDALKADPELSVSVVDTPY